MTKAPSEVWAPYQFGILFCQLDIRRQKTPYDSHSLTLPHLKDDPKTVDKAIVDCKEILDVVMEGNVKEWLS